MKKVLVLVEGQTEEKFVRAVLAPFFDKKNIFLTPTTLNTKIVKDGPNFKGGISSYGKVKRDLKKLLNDSSLAMVTTLIDFYGLPKDFPGFDLVTNQDCYQKVKILEDKFKRDIDYKLFVPYFQLHEFESLLFSSCSLISQTIPAMKDKLSQLEDIRNQFNNPEEINNEPETCPSRRLLKLFPGYQKPLFGSIISEKIGLATIRQECPHFNEWIVKMEAI